ncbi:major facilitator superfamily protein [Hirsutella rhossiliensis]|uniref:Sugar transporter domain-containing protein n=1 Tax=Hirsutella rhossiliensis TaxID=111463 RepID=A0A9P8SI14_9HYPO|nr:sugar transporter domain-containing protein [Hirsutella rhossiliensis]KAH0963723.1 sugar transporter domain-containing protein [Hirsutella rhossiliensis]
MVRELHGRGLLLTISTVTSLGFMLIGYDNGLMGGLVNSPAFNATFRSPKPRMIGLIVAIFEIGCFLGSISAAVFGDRFGRRRTIGHGCWIMIVGAVLQATSFSREQLIIGRIVSGIGLGIVNSTVPVLQAEFSPRASRGIYVCAQLSTLNFGIFLVYWIDYAFSSGIRSYAWRVPVILQCFCIVPILVILPFIPETPRWLAAHDRPDECLKVLARMRSAATDDAEVLKIHGNILQTVALESSMNLGSWGDFLKNDQVQSQKRLLIACAIQSFQQLGGINAVIYYTSTLFEKSVGFSPHMSALMSGILQTWFFIASFIPWFLIDRIGRKPLFLSMISLMAGVMAIQAGLIYQVDNDTPRAHGAAIGAAVMLFVFQGAFTVGFQATVWVYPSEILPLRLRQRGSSLSTAANWIFNYMVVQVTPIAIDRIGWRTYVIFAVLNSIWVPIIFLFFPETKGLELEDVDRLFAKQNFLDDSTRVQPTSVAAVQVDFHEKSV